MIAGNGSKEASVVDITTSTGTALTAANFTVITIDPPALTLAGAAVKDASATGTTVTVPDVAAPPRFAVTTTFSVDDVADVTTETTPDVFPAGIDIIVGTGNLVDEDSRLTITPPMGAASVSVIDTAALPPPTTDIGATTSDFTTVGLTMTTVSLVSPATVTSTLQSVALDTELVVPAKLTVAFPDGTLMLPGTTNTLFVLVIVSDVPLAGATPLNVTVKATGLPPRTEVGVAMIDLTLGVLIEMFATTAIPFALAVTFAVTSDETTNVAIGIVTDDFPAGTDTDVGMTNDVMLDVSFTISPPVGAGTVRSIVAVPLAPPVNSDGVKVMRCGAGTRMASTVDANSALAVALIVA